MSIYQVLITRVKIEQRESMGGYKYDEELRAYSESQYFSSLEKAQAFCQQYLLTPIKWTQLTYGEIWTHEFDGTSFSIYLERDSDYDTTSKPPLPTKFVSLPDRD